VKILIVITSTDRIAKTGRMIGFWLEELSAAYYLYKEAGAEVVLASPQGGGPPVAPRSLAGFAMSEASLRFLRDTKALAALGRTARLAEIFPESYSALYYPGGHGSLWDLPRNRDSLHLIEGMFAAGKPVAAVCHGPAALLHARRKQSIPLLAGKAATCLTNSEEDKAGFRDELPFMLEDELRNTWVRFERGKDFESHVVVDGNLVTGQNPASTEDTARRVIRMLQG
jgi:putative intracellular protease/amidase